MNNSKFAYEKERAFQALLFKIFNDFTKSLTVKSKNKNKKIIYDIMKKLIFADSSLFKHFVEKIAPKLKRADWRKNIYSSWSLEQQKKEKKHFCGL